MTKRQTFRVGAALTAFAYLLGWMLVLAHNVTEQHVVCLEHGDLVHAGEDGHGDHADVSADDAEPRDSIAAYPTHDDHEHCAIGPFHRDEDDLAVASLSASIDTVDVPSWENVLELQQAPRPPPISILSLAPKTSPPLHT